ncbi:MAG: hypothetical protein HZA35_01105 [Parcubacteria group bacterium]|nr:hypothetical protein [Parcubacteria group bacterium]
MNDVKELVIQLPTMSTGNVPQTRSFRWCAELHKALRPLSKYKVQDGSRAVSVEVAAGYSVIAHLNRSFEETTDWNFEDQIKDFICRALLCNSSATYCGVVYFGLADFLGDAAGAREKFARVIAHLEEHAVPQVAPEYVTNALAALQGKEV